MTAEEYIVEKLKEQEEEIKLINDLICEKDAEISMKNQELKFIVDLIEFVESEPCDYCELTVWEDDAKGIFKRLEKIVEKYKDK